MLFLNSLAEQAFNMWNLPPFLPCSVVLPSWPLKGLFLWGGMCPCWASERLFLSSPYVSCAGFISLALYLVLILFNECPHGNVIPFFQGNTGKGGFAIHTCMWWAPYVWVVGTFGLEGRAKFYGFFGELRDQVLCAKYSLATKIIMSASHREMVEKQ